MAKAMVIAGIIDVLKSTTSSLDSIGKGSLAVLITGIIIMLIISLKK